MFYSYHSNYYTNKIHKLRGVPQKLGSPVSVLVPLVKFLWETLGRTEKRSCPL